MEQKKRKKKKKRFSIHEMEKRQSSLFPAPAPAYRLTGLAEQSDRADGAAVPLELQRAQSEPTD